MNSGKPQPIRRGEVFANPHIDDDKRTLKDGLLWALGRYKDPIEKLRVPERFEINFSHEKVCPVSPSVTWAGHSSFIIQSEGVVFLTDPVWSKRCSPLKFLGPKRQHEAPFKIEQLDRIHYVLISHDHYDHLDKASVLKLHRHFPSIRWIVPEGLTRWFHKRGIHNVVELSWWQKHSVPMGHVRVHITAVPAQHFSGRRLTDRNQTLWAGFVVEIEKKKRTHKRFYFAGDTGYNATDFKAIGSSFGKMDLSLIPIGAFSPRDFQRPMHIDPYEAVQIHSEVNSDLSVGCHWNTFRLSEEERLRPIFDLEEAKKEKGLHTRAFRVLYPGQTINW